MRSKHKYEIRKAMGLCVRCGKNKPDGIYVTCRACRIRQSELYYARKERKNHVKT